MFTHDTRNRLLSIVQPGLYYYRARYYWPEIGRFLQTDPIGHADQLNLYAYVHNDPINNVDPSGEDTVTLTIPAEIRGGRSIQWAIDVLTDSEYTFHGAEGAIGIAISFPGIVGGEWDVGVIGSAGLTGYDYDPGDQSNGPVFPGLPSAAIGIEIGYRRGSVEDMAGGPQHSVSGSTNIGRRASRAIVQRFARLLPRGRARDFVEGPVSKTAEAWLGLSVSLSGTFNEDNDALDGIAAGIHKGINIDVNASAQSVGVCTLRAGCTHGNEERGSD